MHGSKLILRAISRFLTGSVCWLIRCASLTAGCSGRCAEGMEPLLSLRRNGVWFLTARGQSPAADEALEKLCRLYWWPLYGFVRRQGYAPEEAQDLTQGFFAMLLERRDLDAVRREKRSITFHIFWLHSKISSLRRIGARWPSNVVKEDRL